MKNTLFNEQKTTCDFFGCTKWCSQTHHYLDGTKWCNHYAHIDALISSAPSGADEICKPKCYAFF